MGDFTEENEREKISIRGETEAVTSKQKESRSASKLLFIHTVPTLNI